MSTKRNTSLHATLKLLAWILLLLFVQENDISYAQSHMVKIIDIQEMSSESLSGDWNHVLPENQRFYTSYTVEHNSESTYLKLRSGGAGSWIEKDLSSVDISKFSLMEWTWMVTRFPVVEWEEDISQNDFAVRIELVYDFKGNRFNPLNIVRKGFFTTFFKGYPPEMIISYVWSYKVPAERSFVSPSDKKMTVIPIESGPSMQGRWIEERRDIQADFDKYIGNDNIALKKIRIRCDTDDSQSNAESRIQKLVLTDN